MAGVCISPAARAFLIRADLSLKLSSIFSAFGLLLTGLCPEIKKKSQGHVKENAPHKNLEVLRIRKVLDPDEGSNKDPGECPEGW